MVSAGVLFVPLISLLIYIYVKLNDAKLSKVPPEVRAQASCDFSPENIRLTAKRLKDSPLELKSHLPPRTGRRYVVVGGVSEEFVLLRIVTQPPVCSRVFWGVGL
jgi:hypothetical protein